MPYSAITSRRIPYDINGTEIGLRIANVTNYVTFFNLGIASWLTSTQKTNLNKEDGSYHLGGGGYDRVVGVWFFFPEKYEIEAIGYYARTSGTFYLQGSNDTANGIDGTWESAVMAQPTTSYGDYWRREIATVSFSEPKKVIRLQVNNGLSSTSLSQIHIYGRKAAGETPDDILFTDVDGNELTAVMDFGDRPEGTTVIKSFKVKNASTTKIANNVNLQLNHADFLISLSPSGPWTATIDIASIPANSLSAEIFIKNTLGPPLLILGPKAARIIATVGSFT